jgi:hypothetical protein
VPLNFAIEKWSFIAIRTRLYNMNIKYMKATNILETLVLVPLVREDCVNHEEVIEERVQSEGEYHLFWQNTSKKAVLGRP